MGKKKNKKKEKKKAKKAAKIANEKARRPAMADVRTMMVLPVLNSPMKKQEDHPCYNCIQCCSYVATEIDEPTDNADYDCVLWYLYHPGVSVFLDFDGDWYIQFDSKCENLTENGLCGIYETRPEICRDYDWKECEVRWPEEPLHKASFERADDFLVWLEKRRPKSFKKYMKYKRKGVPKKVGGELGRVAKAS